MVGDAGEELIHALRGAGARRFRVIPPEELLLDAPPDSIEGGFDVVFTGAPADHDGRSLLAAQALLGDGGQLVVIAGHATPLLGDSDVEQLERRRAAILRELVECEAALVQSEDLRDGLQNQMRAMKLSASWRLTRPLRWFESKR